MGLVGGLNKVLMEEGLRSPPGTLGSRSPTSSSDRESPVTIRVTEITRASGFLLSKHLPRLKVRVSPLGVL